MIKFNAQLVTLDAAAEDGTPTRTITGLAVPWNVVANLSNDVGPVKFLEGSISVDGPMPKLLEYQKISSLYILILHIFYLNNNTFWSRLY